MFWTEYDSLIFFFFSVSLYSVQNIAIHRIRLIFDSSNTLVYRLGPSPYWPTDPGSWFTFRVPSEWARIMSRSHEHDLNLTFRAASVTANPRSVPDWLFHFAKFIMNITIPLKCVILFFQNKHTQTIWYIKDHRHFWATLWFTSSALQTKLANHDLRHLTVSILQNGDVSQDCAIWRQLVPGATRVADHYSWSAAKDKVPGWDEVILELDRETETHELETDFLKTTVGLGVDLDTWWGRTPEIIMYMFNDTWWRGTPVIIVYMVNRRSTEVWQIVYNICSTVQLRRCQITIQKWTKWGVFNIVRYWHIRVFQWNHYTKVMQRNPSLNNNLRSIIN